MWLNRGISQFRHPDNDLPMPQGMSEALRRCCGTDLRNLSAFNIDSRAARSSSAASDGWEGRNHIMAARRSSARALRGSSSSRWNRANRAPKGLAAAAARAEWQRGCHSCQDVLARDASSAVIAAKLALAAAKPRLSLLPSRFCFTQQLLLQAALTD